MVFLVKLRSFRPLVQPAVDLVHQAFLFVRPIRPRKHIARPVDLRVGLAHFLHN